MHRIPLRIGGGGKPAIGLHDGQLWYATAGQTVTEMLDITLNGRPDKRIDDCGTCSFEFPEFPAYVTRQGDKETGKRLLKALPSAFRGVVGIGVEQRMATASTPEARTASIMRETSTSDSDTTAIPSGPTRSSASIRLSRGTSAGEIVGARS